jgi:hypothetical protein
MSSSLLCLAFWYSAPLPPLPVDFALLQSEHVPSSVDPIEVVIQFESSNKWPDDLLAIVRIKSAFYIRMANALQSTNKCPAVVGYAFDTILRLIVHQNFAYFGCCLNGINQK